MDKVIPATGWIYWILFGMTISVGFLKVTFSSRFNKFLRLPISGGYLDDYEDDKSGADSFTIVFDILSLFAASLLIFAYQNFNHHHVAEFVEWKIYLRFILIIALYFTLQGFIHHSVGHLFKEYLAFHHFHHQKMVFLRWSGLLILPLLWLYHFTTGLESVWIYTAIFGLIFLYLWGLGRAALYMINHAHLSAFHIFLYLCALEIAPLAIVGAKLF